jgi:hypothetical protein
METTTQTALKASDLRIGNWVSYGEGKFKQVDFSTLIEVSQQSLADYNNYGRSIEPIPLTPEILLKSGFENRVVDFNIYELFIKQNKNFRLSFYDWDNEPEGLSYVYESDSPNDYESVPTLADIKYLHQLQNLFFALTGEELPINL